MIEDIREIEGCLCQSCGGRYKVDVMVPDDIWAEIKPSTAINDGGLLCGPCIMFAIEARGEFGAFQVEEIT